MYLSDCGARYNDTEVVYDEKIYQKLLENDIDDLLAKHIAHLFIRDSISLFTEKVHQDDEKELDHFENIQSTNWQTMRFKVPPLHSGIGWRVEFRPCEVQITDFENAAFCVFIVLLTRAILTFKLNMLIPISKVDENMMKSQKRNAVLEEKFWFRKDIFSRDCEESLLPFEKMTINEIINGKAFTPAISLRYVTSDVLDIISPSSYLSFKVSQLNLFLSNTRQASFHDSYVTQSFTWSFSRRFKFQGGQLISFSCLANFLSVTLGDDFVGLVPLVKQYLVSLDCDADTACTIHQYLKLISLRATGSAMTTATWIRNFIMNHPEYNILISPLQQNKFDFLINFKCLYN
ncbi:Glutamate--cysteine ligase [Armadillidium vulgare]|nr:Glutamate--cysteine ligase [Armadillidium vulgare]